MRHLHGYRKLGRVASHRRAMLRNMATSLVLHERIETTVPKAKELRPFVERLIVPQASAVWSADPRQMWTFPARFLVEFFANHGMLGFAKRPKWQTIVGGSEESSRYIVYSDVPGGVFRTHGSSFVPLPEAISSPPHRAAARRPGGSAMCNRTATVTDR